MTAFRFLPILAAALLAPMLALAHHGWSWTDGGAFRLTGVIQSAKLGNPHGVLTIATDDEIWTAEIGQPWRNSRAGLSDAQLVPGTVLTLEGERSADPREPRMKAERIILDGKLYDLYPGRD